MRFVEALPYLEAGRRVRHDNCIYRLDENGILMLCRPDAEDMPARSAKLTWTDWEVVEEPAPVKPDDAFVHALCRMTQAKLELDIRSLEDTVARLSQGGVFADTLVERDQTIARLTRERDEAAGKSTRLEQRFGMVAAHIRDLAEDWGQR